VNDDQMMRIATRAFISSNVCRGKKKRKVKEEKE
jgi:hypothetical protein